MPGFVRWLDQVDAEAAEFKPVREKLQAALNKVNHEKNTDRSPNGIARRARMRCSHSHRFFCALYRPPLVGDPVAKFHLGNGARLQRINWAGDLSKNGIRQSLGMMVNYLYDLAKVEEYHQRFLEGNVVHAQAVARLV